MIAADQLVTFISAYKGSHRRLDRQTEEQLMHRSMCDERGYGRTVSGLWYVLHFSPVDRVPGFTLGASLAEILGMLAIQGIEAGIELERILDAEGRS